MADGTDVSSDLTPAIGGFRARKAFFITTGGMERAGRAAN